jgi:hypothetical protein
MVSAVRRPVPRSESGAVGLRSAGSNETPDFSRTSVGGVPPAKTKTSSFPMSSSAPEASFRRT